MGVELQSVAQQTARLDFSRLICKSFGMKRITISVLGKLIEFTILFHVSSLAYATNYRGYVFAASGTTAFLSCQLETESCALKVESPGKKGIGVQQTKIERSSAIWRLRSPHGEEIANVYTIAGSPYQFSLLKSPSGGRLDLMLDDLETAKLKPDKLFTETHKRSKK